MNMYRDKVTIDGESVRCNVYLLSTTKTMFEGGNASNRVIVVSVPTTAPVTSVTKSTPVEWHGDTYKAVDKAVPIMALGRLDHQEITCQRIVG